MLISGSFYCNHSEAHSRGLDGSERSEGRTASGGCAPLGNLTESSVKKTTLIDQKTGEIQAFILSECRREYVQEKDPDTARIEARNGRYSLQNQAVKLLRDSETPRGGQWRVLGCTRRRIAADVAVMYSPTLKRAHFANLMVCGSVWTCPPCAAKVGERRKQEVVEACNIHVEVGGGLYMVTLTFAHTRNDDVKALVKRLRDALTWLRKQTRYKKLMQYIDFVGLIRALEVTHGEANGWHPHVHELWLTKDKMTRAKLRTLQDQLFTLWHEACARAGLGLPNRKAGVNIIPAESAQEYITKFGREPKWGAGSELTKAHTKRGRKASRTPFDLLRSSAEGDSRAGALFVEFAHAFFGARQLFWSPGLKAAFGIEEMTDEEIAAQQDEIARILCRITADQWRAVLSQPFDSRGILLSLAETGGSDAVYLFLSGLRSSWRGAS